MAQEYLGDDLVTAAGVCELRSGIERPVRLSLGGCASAIGTERQGAMRRSAHAHTSKADPLRGWMCFKSANAEKAIAVHGTPTRLFAHEWAHLATWQGHTARWRALMCRLGHPSEAKRYEARQREALERRGRLVPCPVEAAGVECPFGNRPGHRHSERVVIYAAGRSFPALPENPESEENPR